MSAARKISEAPENRVEIDPRNIYQRLHAVMMEVTYVQKERKQGMKYSIVSHDVVTAKVRPALVKEGVLYYPINIQMSQVGNRTQMHMEVAFVNIDRPEDRIIVATAGYGIDDQDKGPGKAISYAVKYALLKALGLESGDDPDEDQQTVHVNGVCAALEVAINLAANADELATVAPQIKDKAASGDLTSAQVQLLRQKYAAKQKALAVPAEG